MTPTDLDDQIRDVVGAVARSAPEPTPFANILSHQLSPERSAERTQGRGLAAAAAGLALVLAITGTLVWLRSNAGTTSQPAASVSATHEIVEYSQTAAITCPTGAPRITGEFDHMRLEIWGSVELGRFRTQVTYPDGSTRDRLIEGSPYRATRTWVRGEQRGQNVNGCEGTGTTSPGAIEPAQTTVGALNPMAPIPTATNGQPIARIPAENALRVGHVTDSRGRAAILWRAVVTGIAGSDLAIEQTEEWLLDPNSDLVLEHRFRDAVRGLGETTSRTVLLEAGTDPVDPSVFDSDGYRPVIGADVGQELPAADTTDVVPSTSTATDWIWPAKPRREEPTDLARRFAHEVLGWTTAYVVTRPGPSGPTFVTITQSGRATLRILVVPTADGGQKIQQIGDGVGATTTGLALAFATFPAATSAEIISAPGGILRAWRSDAPSLGENAQTTDLVKTGPATLILFRDAEGHVVGANGGVTGG